MKIRFLILCVCIVIATGFCTKKSQEPEILQAVPEGAQAVSLKGEPLYASTPSDSVLAKLGDAKNAYDADPENADIIIWYGRWTAYAGDYREAIRIYTQGISKLPEDARFYRHRGHRHISIREFDRAIQDFEKAATLIEGKEDRIEPDGMPNAKNIPISTLHSNIWYHLGLAYYLKHDLENALRVYCIGVETSNNDDKLVSTTHWLYMIFRLLGMEEEADKALEPIHKEMNIIENQVYHRLCLLCGQLACIVFVLGVEITVQASQVASPGRVPGHKRLIGGGELQHVRRRRGIGLAAVVEGLADCGHATE